MAKTELLLDQSATLAALKSHLNAEMLAAAEPLIQAAVKSIEIAMREQLAQSLVKLIDRTYSMHQVREELHIVVHRQPER